MATASDKPDSQTTATRPPSAEVVRYEKLIDSKLRKTRRQLRIVDLASCLLLLAAATLGYLLVVALLDHWVIHGGLSFLGRLLALGLWLTGSIVYCWYTIAPLLIHRINPVYAAHTIERSRPSLKNSVVNFLMLRGRPENISQSVFEAIERQAATGLSQVTVEHTVDRSKLIKLGWLLLAIVAACAVYKVASPKDPLRSFGRIIAPWANIEPPTRVVIRDIEPGTTKLFHDQFVTIRADVSGVAADEQVQVFYTTADGQVVERAVVMNVPAGEIRYAAELPPHAGGLQQDIDYYLAAGDARSETYHIKVLTTPSIVVDHVAYDFPAYTDMADRTIERRGDLLAIEGTRVTVYATANDEIQAAHIDFDCDGQRDMAMQVDGKQARATFTLALKKGTEEPEHASYQLRFVNDDGEENPKPIRYKIEVTPDRAPQVAIVEPEFPEGEETPVLLGDIVTLKVRASDADFKLSNVKIRAERKGQMLVDRALMPAPISTFNGSFLLDTSALKLAAGDELLLWAEAADNRQPTPNAAKTPKHRLRIVGDDQQQQRQGGANQKPEQKSGNPRNDHKEQPNKDQQDKERGDPQGKPDPGKNQNQDEKAQPSGQGDQAKPPSDNDQQGKGREGQPKPDKSAQGSSGNQANPEQGEGNQDAQNPQESERVDPDADPGKAIQKILDRRNQDRKESPEQQRSNDDRQANRDKQPREDQKASPDKQQPNQPDRNENQQPRPDKDQSQQPAEQQARGDQRNEAQSGTQPSGDESGQEAGDDAAPMKPTGDNRSGTSKPQPNNSGGITDNKDAEPSAGGERSNDGSGNVQQQSGAADKAGSAEKSAGNDSAQRGSPPKSAAKDAQGKAGDQSNQDNAPKGSGAPQEGASAKSQDKQGDGGQARGQEDKQPKKPDEKQQPSNQKGSNAESHGQGDAGSGVAGENKSPEPQEGNAPRDKRDGEIQHRKDGESEAESPSNSKHQSDSKGGESGDRSGGGGEGGGQRSNSQGTGSSGQNTAADEGGGRADQSGQGETTDRAGDKQPGQGSQPTAGAQSSEQGRRGQGGKKQGPGGTSGQQAPDTPDKDKHAASPPSNTESGKGTPNSDRQPGKRPGAGDQSTGSGQPTGGGGLPMDNAEENRNPREPQREPGGDEANRDYANKATDLAIEYLKDQLAKDKPDQKLLDELKWSREDMRRFVEHWEQLKRAANANPEARKKLDEKLSSLGLTPRGAALSGGQTRDRASPTVRDGRRSEPPLEYRDQYNSFTTGSGKQSKADER